MKKTIGFLLLACAYGLLIPGLTLPMLTVSGTVERTKLVDVGQEIVKDSKDIPGFVKEMVKPLLSNMRVEGSIPAFTKTNSILNTAKQLFENNHKPVAALILIFSVGIPLFKALLMIAAHLPFKALIKQRLLWISSITSKWSMADVFVVAIFVAYLAANGLKESRALVDFSSELGDGFYYFLGYCLLSILATQLITGGVTWRSTNSHSPIENDNHTSDQTITN